ATALDLTGEHKVQWVFNRSRYECTAQFSNEKQGLYAIDFHKPIYKIQRRQNFRTIIPSQWKNEIRIHLRNDQSFNIKGLIIDISLNGCYFEIQTSNPLTNNDSITGEIEIADFKVLKFSGKIVRKSTMANGFGYGIHFLNIENFGKEILNNITLKAARAMRDYTQD
ncbi:MAG: PilZ domain-containing protein, partial [Bdellovibrionales bacterium]|nr:PilZ domain-containing protein [Bdellovibrionales bacterium]